MNPSCRQTVLFLFDLVVVFGLLPPALADSRSFLFTTAKEICQPENGMLMICPGHAHGPPDLARRQLEILARKTPENVKSAIWLCRTNQLAMIERFSSIVDRTVLNPFVHTASHRARHPLWEGKLHPVLCYLEQIREKAGNRELLACVDLRGERFRFRGERNATFGEIKWLVLAVTGSGYQGIAWRGNVSQTPFETELGILTHNISVFRHELGEAEPFLSAIVDGAGMLAACRRTDGRLLVFLLDPRQMVLDNDLYVTSPSTLEMLVQGTIVVNPPMGQGVRSAIRLDGNSMPVRKVANGYAVPFSFVGGGTMLILDLVAQHEQGGTYGQAAQKETPGAGEKARTDILNPGDLVPRIKSRITDAVSGIRSQALTALSESMAGMPSFSEIAGPVGGGGSATVSISAPLDLYIEYQALSNHLENGTSTISDTSDQAPWKESMEAVSQQLLSVLPLTANMDTAWQKAVVEYGLVLPLLRTPDPGWTEAESLALPTWLVSEKNLVICEDFLLRVHRPLTAWQIVRTCGGERSRSETVVEYLSASVDRLIGRGELCSAEVCCRKAIAMVGNPTDRQRIATLRIQLGQILAEEGLYGEAATAVGQISGDDLEAEFVDRAQALKLQYLCHDHCPEKALEEFQQVYSRLGREISPQLMHSGWIAAKQCSNREVVNELREKFLNAYPADPLSGEMYLESAIVNLSRNNRRAARDALKQAIALGDKDTAQKAQRILSSLDR